MDSYIADSLFQPSNLAQAIRDTMDPSSGEASYLFGSILSIPHYISARTLAVLGHDFVMIDAQHTYNSRFTRRISVEYALTKRTY
jgi:2-keto-3-deoxy-L-rhamnonate aldolase RhmA